MDMLIENGVFRGISISIMRLNKAMGNCYYGKRQGSTLLIFSPLKYHGIHPGITYWAN
jgi:hypothetical protein